LFFEIPKIYGDIVKLEYLAYTFVLSYDPSQWETILRSVGKNPEPLQLFPLLERERRLRKQDPNYKMSPIALEGDEWRANRSVLDKKFMIVPQVQKYTSRFNDIGDDLVSVFKKKAEQNNGYIPNLEQFIYAFSTEGIGSVIFDYRIRVLNDPVPELAQKFLSTLQQTFAHLSHLMSAIPLYYYINTPNWNKYKKSMDDLESLCQEFIRRAEEQNKNKSSEERVDLLHFMNQLGVERQQTLKNASTMFFVGSDSTSNSLVWAIYNLGRFPAVQDALRKEVRSVLGNDKPMTTDSLRQMKYLRNTIKESLRLTPTLHSLVRFLDEPVVVSGYEIPRKTPIILPLMVVNKDPKYFPDPYNFKPERWNTEEHPLQKWINLPFGFGPRMCQGFRISELEMYVAIAKLIQNFEWTVEEEVEPFLESFIRPDRPLKVHWKVLT
jgi:cytochrome P450